MHVHVGGGLYGEVGADWGNPNPTSTGPSTPTQATLTFTPTITLTPTTTPTPTPFCGHPPPCSPLQMQNLREFARCMALLSDKFQLMVSRDVSVVPACPATLDTTASGGGSNPTLPKVSHQSRALSGTFSRTSGGTGDGAGRAEDGGADAAAVM